MGGNQEDSGEKDFLKYEKEKRVCKHSTTTLTQLSRDDGSEMKQGSGVRKLIRAQDTAKVKCHHSRPLHPKSSRSALGLYRAWDPLVARSVSRSLNALKGATKCTPHATAETAGENERLSRQPKERPGRRTRKQALHVLCGNLPGTGREGGAPPTLRAYVIA